MKALVALFALIAGCAGVPFPPVRPAVEGGSDAPPATADDVLFRTDDRVQLQAHAVLTRGGTSLDFGVAALAIPPGEVRAAGLNELGGKLFEATLRDGTTDVQVATPFVPAGLPDSVLSALRTILLRPPAGVAIDAVVVGETTVRAMQYRDATHRVLCWHGDLDAGLDPTGGARTTAPSPDGGEEIAPRRVDHWLIGRDDTVERTVVVESWHADPDHPLRILIVDHGGGFELVLFVAEWRGRSANGG